jgi:tetratricopeptide (TPR) repeat protein
MTLSIDSISSKDRVDSLLSQGDSMGRLKFWDKALGIYEKGFKEASFKRLSEEIDYEALLSWKVAGSLEALGRMDEADTRYDGAIRVAGSNGIEPVHPYLWERMMSRFRRGRIDEGLEDGLLLMSTLKGKELLKKQLGRLLLLLRAKGAGDAEQRLLAEVFLE